jgi:hypothetical protein
MQVTPAGFESKCLLRALAEYGKLKLAERAFHTQQKAIVDQPRVVNTVFADQQTAHQAAELQQLMPVTAVPGEPRCLDCQHRARTAITDRYQ